MKRTTCTVCRAPTRYADAQGRCRRCSLEDQQPNAPLAPPTPDRAPLTLVSDLDRPDERQRLIRLPAQEAVIWCMSQELGANTREEMRDLALRTFMDNGHWICGHYKAKEDTGWLPPGKTSATTSRR